MNDQFDRIIKEFRDQISSKEEWLGAGSAEDMEDYRKVCGAIEALRDCEQYVVDTKAKMYQDEED